MLFDGRSKMYLHTKFALSHDIQVGCVLTFCYQGGEEMSMKVFDDTSCHQHYQATTKRTMMEHDECSFFAAKMDASQLKPPV
jgi:hypothetical protein